MSAQARMDEDHMGQPRSVIAVDLGGTKLTVAIVDDRLREHHAIHREIAGLPYDRVIQTTVDTIAQLAVEHPEVAGIGVAAAGQVDERTGIISHREIRRGEEEREIAALAVHEYALAELIRERTGLPAFVENDGNAAVLAEWRAGVGQGKGNVVCLVIGTYMGSGVVARGSLVRRRTSGPLLGGIVTPDPTTRELRYLGVLVGGNVLEAAAAMGGEPAMPGKEPERTAVAPTAAAIAARARAGDPEALRLFEAVAASLRIACINAINEWDCEVLALAGGLIAGASDLLLPGLQAFVEEWRLPGADETGPNIALARFGGDAGMIGAALWALENLGLPFAIEER